MFTEDNYLKLYVEQDRDVVWMADGTGTPRDSGCSVSSILKLLRGRQLGVRVLGMAQNARLLAYLCEMAEQGELPRVEIASPMVCETHAERANPEQALFRMRQCLLSPSLGGWHIASTADTAIYRLAAKLQSGPPDEASDALIRAHPVWRDLSFIGRVDMRACGQVLTYLLDPRWYVDPEHPDRVSRANSFMGVTVKARRRECRNVSNGDRDARYQAILRAWKCSPPPSRVAVERPEFFLWRRYLECGQGSRGDQRASGSFLDYLLRVWSQRLTDASENPVELFWPSAIFRPFEAAAYRQHVASYSV